MGPMLKDALAHYPVAFAASMILLAVVTMFTMIGVWTFRSKSKPVFEHASRLPLEEGIQDGK